MNRVSVVTLAVLVVIATLGCAIPSQAGKTAPTISSISPASVVAGSPDFTLNIFGSNFASNSVVLLNGNARVATFISRGQLAVTVFSADIAQAGSIQVVVAAPNPSTPPSNSFALNVVPALQIATSNLPTAVVQLPYSADVKNSGGIPPYTWRVASGQLPPGLALAAANGAISGIPGQAGDFNFFVQVSDSSPTPQTASQPLALTVTTPSSPLVISTTILPNGTVQLPYGAALAATGGLTPYNWSVVSRSLPPGLSLGASTGAISGTPTTSGQYPFTVQVKDSAASPQTATQAFTISISGSSGVPTVSVSPSSLSFAPQVLGTTSAEQNVKLDNTSAVPASVSSAAASGDFAISRNYCQQGIAPSTHCDLYVTFTPTATGTRTGQLTINDNGQGSPHTVTLAGTGSSGSPATLSVSTTSLPSAIVAQAYASQLQASGGTTPYSWSLISGSLPSGLSLSSFGAISGTPGAAGTSSFTVQVKDSAASPQTATQAFSLTVNVLTVSVTVSPTSVALQPSQTQQFTATVSGTSSTGVTWSVNGIVGGNSSVGTVLASGLYAAPAAVPSPATVVVAATSAADTTKSDSASVLIISSSPSPAELPRSVTDVTMPDTTGYTVVNVAAGSGVALQAAIDAAVGRTSGSILKLVANSTYVGPIVLKNSTTLGAGQWIIIRSDTADANLPAPGVRIAPSFASVLPKIQGGPNFQALTTLAAAHHYRFIGVEFNLPPGITDLNAREIVEFDAANDPSLNCGVVFPTCITSTSLQVHHIIVDRCYVHGNPGDSSLRGISMQADNGAVINSFINEIHISGRDDQAILLYGSQGPVLIENNFLSAVGENILSGGVGSNSTLACNVTPCFIPSDVTIRRNHFWKNLAWNGSRFHVKNLLELKNARRYLIEGNVFENVWGDGQDGTAIVTSVKNQTGEAPWNAVEDVTFRLNIIKNASCGLGPSGQDNEFGHTSLPCARHLYQNNLTILNSALALGGCIGRWYFETGTVGQLTAHDITTDHNTSFDDGAFIFAVQDDGLGHFPQMANHIWTNNIAGHGAYGVNGQATPGEGTATLNAYYPAAVYSKNAIYGPNVSAIYPPNNFFPADIAAIQFVNFASGDYHLAATSPFKNAGTDLKDLGADIDAINAATAGVVKP